MPQIMNRIEDQDIHSGAYFTMLSIILGAGVGSLIYKYVQTTPGILRVRDVASPLETVVFLIVAFFALSATWHEYARGTARVKWRLDWMDTFVPFLLGASLLVSSLSIDRPVWFLIAFSSYLFFGSVAYLNVARHAKKTDHERKQLVIRHYHMWGLLVLSLCALYSAAAAVLYWGDVGQSLRLSLLCPTSLVLLIASVILIARGDAFEREFDAASASSMRTMPVAGDNRRDEVVKESSMGTNGVSTLPASPEPLPVDTPSSGVGRLSLRQHERAVFSGFYLTIISIVEGVVFYFLVQSIFAPAPNPLPAPPNPELLPLHLAMVFIAIGLVVFEYTTVVTFYGWRPGVLDVFAPFWLGTAQLGMIFYAAHPIAWWLSVAAIFAGGIVAYFNTASRVTEQHFIDIAEPSTDDDGARAIQAFRRSEEVLSESVFLCLLGILIAFFGALTSFWLKSLFCEYAAMALSLS